MCGRLHSEGQFLDRDGAAGLCQTSIRQVGKDPQVDTSAGDLFDVRGEFFAGGVDGIGAHRVPHIVDQMHHQEWPDGRILDHADFQVARAAAEFLQHRINRVGFGEQFGFVFIAVSCWLPLNL